MEPKGGVVLDKNGKNAIINHMSKHNRRAQAPKGLEKLREGVKKSTGVQSKSEIGNLILNRRSAIVTAFLLGGGIVYWKSCSSDDKDTGRQEEFRDQLVFDVTNGTARRHIRCEKQVHTAKELVQAIRKVPAVAEEFILHQNELLDVLRANQSDRMLYLLEGLKPSVKAKLLADEEWMDRVHTINTAIERDPQVVARATIETAQRFTTAEVEGILKNYEAITRFLVERRSDASAIHGTEPEDHQAFVDFLEAEIERLRKMQRAQDPLPEGEIARTADLLTTYRTDALRIRHEFMQRLLTSNSHSGKDATILIGAGHFASGARVSEIPQHPLENYLREIPNARVTVRDSRELLKLIRHFTPRNNVITPQEVKLLMEQT